MPTTRCTRSTTRCCLRWRADTPALAAAAARPPLERVRSAAQRIASGAPIEPVAPAIGTGLYTYIVGHANFSSPATQDYDATCYAATEMAEQARDVVGRCGRVGAVLRGGCVRLSNMLSMERTVLKLKHGT